MNKLLKRKLKRKVKDKVKTEVKAAVKTEVKALAKQEIKKTVKKKAQKRVKKRAHTLTTKLSKKALLIATLTFAATFTVYMLNLENKLIYYVVRPFLNKHYDAQKRDRRIV